ncbi:helix-turn-helix domain-containing protein [Streptomyces sp. NPDC015131]|uniref:helix-turn-helix domain-containing protein n=1 Tax=Streptomyces sp. NPDC015131 TaxID=3364941 RepID=UPI0036FEB467
MTRSLTSPGPWLVRSLSHPPALEDGGDCLYLGMHVQGRITLVRDGSRRELAPGDLVFHDPARPGLLHFGDGARMTFFRVPRRQLGATGPELDRVVGIPAPGRHGLGALVSDFLSALAAKAEFRRSTVGDRLSRTAVHLLSVLVVELLATATATATDREPAPAASPSAGADMLARIRAYIEEHLMDPQLSPVSIARAHFISVRYLHKLFQQDGTTVSQWIRRRRLEACRTDLSRTGRRLTVAAVAHRWGFTSPSHFSRTFKGAYGMSPREWQTLAPSPHPLPRPPAGLATELHDERPDIALGVGLGAVV